MNDDPAIAAAFNRYTPESKRKRKKYPSEEQRSKATYDVPETIKTRLKEIAIKERLGKRPSKIAAAFLAYALEAYEEGKITLETQQDGAHWWLEAVD